MSSDFEKLVELTEKVIAANSASKNEIDSLSRLVKNTTDGYWDWHIPSNHEFMSDRFWEILGQDPADKASSPDEWMKLVHPDDLEIAKKSIGAHFASKGKSPYIQEIRYFKPDGSIVWILCKGRVIEWDGDSPVRMVGTHTDITSLKGGDVK